MATHEEKTLESGKTPASKATRAEVIATLALAAALIVTVITIAVRNRLARADIEISRGNHVTYCIDPNHADAAELMLLPGIGRARAEKIVTWRRDRGAFQSLDQVRQACGMPAAEFERIRDSLTLGAPAPVVPQD